MGREKTGFSGRPCPRLLGRLSGWMLGGPEPLVFVRNSSGMKTRTSKAHSVDTVALWMATLLAIAIAAGLLLR